MATKKGKDFVIKVGSTIYGYATDCSITTNTNVTAITTTRFKHKDSGGHWQENETDENSWTVEAGYVVAADAADYKALKALQYAGKPVTIEYTEIEDELDAVDDEAGTTGHLKEKSGGLKETGSAIITSIAKNDPVDGESTFSMSLTGTGPLTFGA